MPKGRYKGQNRIKPVSIKTIAKTINTIANVPVMICAKYNAIMTIEISILMALSIIPTFLFIISIFRLVYFYWLSKYFVVL